jgi:uncharacterized membrane protein HdeD (DUF308 family)
VQRFDTLLEEREVVEDAGRWWLFFLTGIAWLVFALLVFQWDYTTVYAISFLFGVVAVIAGVNELIQITVSTRGWKIARGVLGVVFIVAGLWALLHPDNAFATLAAAIGFVFLFKGIFDMTVAFRTRRQFDLWWLRGRRDSPRLLGCRRLLGEGDSARRLGGSHRAPAWDHRAVPGLQAADRYQWRRPRAPRITRLSDPLRDRARAVLESQSEGPEEVWMLAVDTRLLDLEWTILPLVGIAAPFSRA